MQLIKILPLNAIHNHDDVTSFIDNGTDDNIFRKISRISDERAERSNTVVYNPRVGRNETKNDAPFYAKIT